MRFVDEVRQAIQDEASRAGYGQAAGRVIDRVSNRIQDLVNTVADQLVAAGRSLGAEEHEVRRALVDVGLANEPEMASPVAASGGNDFDRRLSALENFARSRAGYTG